MTFYANQTTPWQSARTWLLITISSLFVNVAGLVAAEEQAKEKSLDDWVEPFDHFGGLFPYYWDNDAGKLWLEINRWSEPFLYVPSMQSGVGSNPIGLDRGLVGQGKVVQFVRVGPKVLLVEPNLRFRAQTDNPNERKAVEDSFAQSILWGFKAEKSEDDRVIIDLTPFLLRDSMGIAEALSDQDEGSYQLDDTRSAIYLPNTKNFPDNTEFEATITFTGKANGAEIRSVSPSSDSITVRLHHSFVRLPDSNYRPRAFDPRAGTFVGASFLDYATPIKEPIRKRFIARHRLKKKNPTALQSPAVEPIIYYLDPGVPEPIKSALVDGAMWWNDAFEAIGFQNAFQVKELPTDADPMDIRYNVIQWVHRATRGWSYGMTVKDPRTGEIIKGKVTLGSLRVRQDYLIAQGLLSPFENGEDSDPRPTEMALARLRQLSAHEVGHTLGFSHNFAASANNRSSVMDYPHPLVRLDENGAIDLSKAYTAGIGSWDKVAVDYAYRVFPQSVEERKALNELLEKARRDGHVYITDQDARPLGGAHPSAHLWDNGSNPIQELDQAITIRRHALNRLSQASIRHGEPWATIEEVLVPIYLFHRYQTEATAKLIGGINYEYAVRGSGQPLSQPIDRKQQSQALKLIIQTLDSEFLELPEALLQLLPPRPPGYPRTSEVFQSRLNVGFDPISAAEAAGHQTLAALLNTQRANRLVVQATQSPLNLGLPDLISSTIDTTWKAARKSGLQREIQKIIEFRCLQQLFALSVSDGSFPETRATAMQELRTLKGWIESQLQDGKDIHWDAHYRYALDQFKAFEEDPSEFKESPPTRLPAGSPIGESHCFFNIE